MATFGSRIIDIAANAALTIILARFLLTTDQYGRLYIAISVIGVASLLGSLGIPSSAARYVTEYNERDDTQVPHIIRRSLVFIFILCAIVSVGLIAGSGLIVELFDEPGMLPLLVMGVFYVTFEALSKFFMSIFQAFNRVTLSAALTAISSVGRLLFATVLVLVGLGTLGAFMGYIVGFALASVVGFWLLYTRFYVPKNGDDPMETGLSRRILEYSVPLTATRGATIVDKKVDTILVGAILGSTPAAFYTVAKQVSDACIAPASSLGYTISPAFGEEKAGNRLERAARLYEHALEHMLILYIPAFVGLLLVADPMVRYVFGENYRGAIPVVQVMGVFILANSVNKITSDGLDYLGRARERAIAKTVMAVSNFVLNLLLIPTIGVVGAAIATAITFSAYTIFNVNVITNELPIRLGTVTRSVVRVCVISGGMGIVVYVLLPYITGIPTLLGVVTAGVSVWAILSAAWGIIDVKRIWSFISLS